MMYCISMYKFMYIYKYIYCVYMYIHTHIHRDTQYIYIFILVSPPLTPPRSIPPPFSINSKPIISCLTKQTGKHHKSHFLQSKNKKHTHTQDP